MYSTGTFHILNTVFFSPCIYPRKVFFMFCICFAPKFNMLDTRKSWQHATNDLIMSTCKSCSIVMLTCILIFNSRPILGESLQMHCKCYILMTSCMQDVTELSPCHRWWRVKAQLRLKPRASGLPCPAL